MKNFDVTFNVIDGDKELILSTTLPSGIEVTLTFTDDNPEEANKVNVKVESHENGELIQDGGCNTAISRSSYEKLKKKALSFEKNTASRCRRMNFFWTLSSAVSVTAVV